MLIENFNKFEVDYKRNETSVTLFEDLYLTHINEVLLIKTKNLLEIFNTDVKNTKIYSNYIAYVDYIFPLLLEKIDDMIKAYNEMEDKKVYIPTNIRKDIDAMVSTRNRVQAFLTNESRKEIENKQKMILHKCYGSILENVNGFTSSLIKKSNSKILVKDNLDLFFEINKKVNEISLSSSYETHNILFNECVKELESEVYTEAINNYNSVVSNFSMVITKTKFDVNTLKLMGNIEDLGPLSNLLYYIHDIEYFIQALFIFHNTSNEKNNVMCIEDFTTVYNEGLTGITKPYIKEKLKLIGSDYKYFYENYENFAKLSRHSKKIIYSINKIIYKLENYIKTNDFEDNAVKLGIRESLEIKLNNIKNNLQSTEPTDENLDKLLKEVILKEVHYLDELRSLSLKELDDIYEENFILGFEELYHKIIVVLKVCDVEVYEPYIGEKFDSKLHIVEFVKPSESFKQGCVIEVLYNGFKIKNDVALEGRVVCAK